VELVSAVKCSGTSAVELVSTVQCSKTSALISDTPQKKIKERKGFSEEKTRNSMKLKKRTA
jgi:hypothetical protein